MQQPTDLLDQVQVFFGEAHPASARIYAQLQPPAGIAGWDLACHVSGPHSIYSRTLPATVKLVDRPHSAAASPPRSGSLLAEAILPDPCFWTPQTPFLYQVHLELRRDQRLVAAADRSLGIRPLGIDDGLIVLESDPWMPMAVARDAVPQSRLSQWRECNVAMYVDDPDPALCAEASRVGVMLLARLKAPGNDLAATLRSLASWPAVAVVVLEADPPKDMAVRQLARNLLFAWYAGIHSADHPPAWADCVVCRGGDADELALRAEQCPLPVIARRPAAQHHSLYEARRQCDFLEALLAARACFTGYIV